MQGNILHNINICRNRVHTKYVQEKMILQAISLAFYVICVPFSYLQDNVVIALRLL